MTTHFSFKDYIEETKDDEVSPSSARKRRAIKEADIPTVWKKKPINSPKTNVEDEEDLDDMDMEIPDEDTELDSDMGDEMDMDTEDDMGDEESEPEDPDRQGVLRTVKSAHLVFKRKDEEGTYEELWIYKIGGKIKDELEIRRDILSATDIPRGETKSEDETQSYELWTPGKDVQFLLISGLPQ